MYFFYLFQCELHNYICIILIDYFIINLIMFVNADHIIIIIIIIIIIYRKQNYTYKICRRIYTKIYIYYGMCFIKLQL